LAGRHAAEEGQRFLEVVRALRCGRVGEVVGIAVWNNQHVAGFKALRRRASKPRPAAAARNDMERYQVLRGWKH
jgi:hypothetical protein